MIPWLLWSAGCGPALDAPPPAHPDQECARCHAEIEAEWRVSAHAHASRTNALYHRVVEQFASVRGPEAASTCAGCHEPALIEAEVSLLGVDPLLAVARVGVSCAACHSVQDASPVGNASLTRQHVSNPIPVEGDFSTLEAHLSTQGPAVLRTATLCVACHRGHIVQDGTVMPGVDDATSWESSSWSDPEGGPARSRDCAGCHMPWTGTRRSHRFAGGNLSLTTDEAQAEAVRAQLEGALELEVGRLGDQLVISIYNAGIGHRFPGGATDLRDAWLEVEVTASGRRWLADRTHGSTLRFGDTLEDIHGQVLLLHELERASRRVAGPGIDPRDTLFAVIPLPTSAEVEVEARLKQRRYRPEVLAAVCSPPQPGSIPACGEQAVVTMASGSLGVLYDGSLRPDAVRAEPFTELALEEVP